MTTAQIIFSFVAAALVLAGGVRVIRGGLEQMIPAAPLGQSGVFVWMLVRGENPVDVTFRWIFFPGSLQIPGQLVWYRVTSSRAGINSVPTPPVAAYGPQGETELSIAA